MQINWSDLARSPGYKSLKASYIRDVKQAGDRLARRGHKPMRTQQELYKHFQWVINRAKHYALSIGCTVSAVLNDWEEKRTYWWLNFYQASNQPKLATRLPSMGVRGMKRRYKRINYPWRNNHHTPSTTRLGKKARWSAAYKRARGRYHRSP